LVRAVQSDSLGYNSPKTKVKYERIIVIIIIDTSWLPGNLPISPSNLELKLVAALADDKKPAKVIAT
jgi:hypothetical protein